MPKIDPVTGCPVMTMAEFWNSEAENEGKGRSGSELQEDFYTDLANEQHQEEDRLRKPEIAQEHILRAWKETVEYLGEEETSQVSAPVAVLEVLETRVGYNFRESTQMIRARCRCENGSERIFKLDAYHDAGTRLDPPDYGEELSWE